MPNKALKVVRGEARKCLTIGDGSWIYKGILMLVLTSRFFLLSEKDNMLLNIPYCGLTIECFLAKLNERKKKTLKS